MGSGNNVLKVLIVAAATLALTACGAGEMKSGAITLSDRQVPPATPSSPVANVESRITPATLIIPQGSLVIMQSEQSIAEPPVAQAPLTDGASGTSLAEESSVCELVFYGGAKARSNVWPARRESCLTFFFGLGRVNGGLSAVQLNIIEAGSVSPVNWKSISAANENPLGFGCALNNQNVVAGSPIVRSVNLSSENSLQASQHCAKYCRRSNEELKANHSVCTLRKYVSPNGIVTLEDQETQINF